MTATSMMVVEWGLPPPRVRGANEKACRVAFTTAPLAHAPAASTPGAPAPVSSSVVVPAVEPSAAVSTAPAPSASTSEIPVPVAITVMPATDPVPAATATLPVQIHEDGGGLAPVTSSTSSPSTLLAGYTTSPASSTTSQHPTPATTASTPASAVSLIWTQESAGDRKEVEVDEVLEDVFAVSRPRQAPPRPPRP
jgi:hypothetical protein